MHLIQSLKNEFCFDLPMFSKYPATSINSYFYKMTLGLGKEDTDRGQDGLGSHQQDQHHQA